MNRLLKSNWLFLLVVSAFLVLGLFLTTVVMGQDGEDDTVDLDRVQEDVVRDLLDQNGRVVTTDDRLAQIAQDHEGGFGGYYFPGHVDWLRQLLGDDAVAPPHPDAAESTVYIYMLDPEQVEAAESAFRAAYRGDQQISRVVPVQGDYRFDHLLEWYRVLSPAMAEAEDGLKTGAVMEIANRIVIGLDNMDRAEDARRLMDDLEIPQGAVVFEDASDAQLLSDEDSVNAKWRPVVGGIQHKIRFGRAYCTIGFVTERNNVDAEGDNPGQQTKEEEEETQAFRNRDDRLVDIGALVPGFGGMYIDPARPDVLNVFMLDADDEEHLAEVERAIDAEFPDAIPPGGIAVVQGQYGIGQLKVWYDDVRTALARSGLVGNGLVGTDLEEDKNRLEVVVDSEELIPQIEKLVAEADVPSGVVRVTVRSQFRFLSSSDPDAQTVRSRIRPIIGGVQTLGAAAASAPRDSTSSAPA